jgi:hypothetical protein
MAVANPPKKAAIPAPTKKAARCASSLRFWILSICVKSRVPVAAKAYPMKAMDLALLNSGIL